MSLLAPARPIAGPTITLNPTAIDLGGSDAGQSIPLQQFWLTRARIQGLTPWPSLFTSAVGGGADVEPVVEVALATPVMGDLGLVWVLRMFLSATPSPRSDTADNFPVEIWSEVP